MPEGPDSRPEAAENGDPAPRQRPPRPTDTTRRLEISAGNATGPAQRRRRGAAATAERVGTIVAAAEQTAEALRARAEARMRERIAEGERAAENRVRAAEDEAAEILELAREEADQAKTAAASEALTILAKAHDDADRTRGEAEGLKAAASAEARELIAKGQQDAEANLARARVQSREILGAARVATASVYSEGTELVSNLREMGDSLRTNAERLLRDVQAIHSRMVAQLDRVDGGASRIPTPRTTERDAGSGRRPRDGRSGGRDDGDELSVPEFIPPG